MPLDPDRLPCVLSIAGSDSDGGAGIQADLKALARCGVHGMTAVTAVTVQNTAEVRAVYPLPPQAIVEQVGAVAEDIGVDAVKIGMLGNVEAIEAVDRALDLVGGAPVVLDPVMVAESGARLLDPAAATALRDRLLPRASVVTPNLAEAEVLAEAAAPSGRGPAPPPPGGVSQGRSPGPSSPLAVGAGASDPAVAGAAGSAPAGAPGPAGAPDSAGTGAPGPALADRTGRGPSAAPAPDASAAAPQHVEHLARAVHGLGPGAVVVTGGHRPEATDLFFDGRRLVPIPGERHSHGAAHGSGCTHSSALAAHLALGLEPLEAARRARAIAGEAVRDGLRGVGRGAGPVDVFGLSRADPSRRAGRAPLA